MRKNFGAKTWFYPLPVLIIGSYDENGKADAMNAAWGGIYDSNHVVLCLSAGHKTTRNIRAKGAFTVSFADAAHVVESDYVGLVSGNNTPDKMEKAGFHTVKSEFVEIIPAVNQVETHVFNQQVKAREYMDKYGVQHESWGPFAEGRKDFFTNPVLNEIGAKYGKSAAQTALRYLIQRGVVVIPKSTHKERMEQNFNVFDFALSVEDMAAIAALDEGESLFFSHYDPATVERLCAYGKSK